MAVERKINIRTEVKGADEAKADLQAVDAETKKLAETTADPRLTKGPPGAVTDSRRKLAAATKDVSTETDRAAASTGSLGAALSLASPSAGGLVGQLEGLQLTLGQFIPALASVNPLLLGLGAVGAAAIASLAAAWADTTTQTEKALEAAKAHFAFEQAQLDKTLSLRESVIDAIEREHTGNEITLADQDKAIARARELAALGIAGREAIAAQIGRDVGQGRTRTDEAIINAAIQAETGVVSEAAAGDIAATRRARQERAREQARFGLEQLETLMGPEFTFSEEFERVQVEAGRRGESRLETNPFEAAGGRVRAQAEARDAALLALQSPAVQQAIAEAVARSTAFGEQEFLDALGALLESRQDKAAERAVTLMLLALRQATGPDTGTVVQQTFNNATFVTTEEAAVRSAQRGNPDVAEPVAF